MSRACDLVGQRFGRLTVVKRVENSKGGDARWMCKCDCGNQVISRSTDLRNGHSVSCGCERGRSKIEDLTGQRFGRLTCIKIHNRKGHRTFWECKCDCGETTNVDIVKLKSGNTKSCGCYRSDFYTSHFKTHGMKHSRIYNIWSSMKARCDNFSSENYYLYGGRGIAVCNEWSNSFESFYEWAMKNGYKNNLSIDRIDVNGNYNPSNCRWVTMKVQQNNKRNNHLLSYQGKTLTISQWSELLGIGRATIWCRICKLGWSTEEALSTPVRTKSTSK